MRASSRILFLGALLPFVTIAQRQNCEQWLLGKLVKADDQARTPVDNVAVQLDESGGVDTTKNGLFRFCLPKVLESGVEVTITATVPGYAVYQPPGGKLRIPPDSDLRTQGSRFNYYRRVPQSFCLTLSYELSSSVLRESRAVKLHKQARKNGPIWGGI